MYDRRAANQKMLNETEDTQQKTKDAVVRIQQQATATEDLGAATLEELRAQGRQMNDINNDIDDVNSKLDTASGLQDKFDVWSGSLFGFGKRKANKEAATEIASKQLEEMNNVKEVFENEKYDMLSRVWKSSSMTLCSNPATKAPQLFDPRNQVSMENSKWSIDFTLAGIDIEGWTPTPKTWPTSTSTARGRPLGGGAAKRAEENGNLPNPSRAAMRSSQGTDCTMHSSLH